VAQTPASREGAHDRHLTGPEADRRLPKLSQEELKALWREYFGVEPPAYRRGFLFRGLAHRIQELTYGGLKPAYQARLDAMIECTESARGGHLSRASARGVRVSDSRMCARKRWLGDSRPLDTRRSLAGAVAGAHQFDAKHRVAPGCADEARLCPSDRARAGTWK
jgi:Protein of unknown function (DUF2924)